MKQSSYDRDYAERRFEVRKLGVPARLDRAEREIERKRYRWDYDNQLWYRDIDREVERRRAKVQARIERDQFMDRSYPNDLPTLPYPGEAL